MRRMLILLCLCGVLTVPFTRTGVAGPWPREQGRTFLSLSWERDLQDDRGYATIYAEYGLTDRLTLGLDAGADPDGLSKAIAFARMPFAEAPGGMRLALEMGVGMAEEQAVIRPAMAFGRSIALLRRDGWLTFDLRATIRPDTLDTAWEGDLTLGLDISPRAKAIMQVQTGQPRTGDAYVKLSSSWVMEGAPGRHLEIGVVNGLKNSDALAARIALWHAF